LLFSSAARSSCLFPEIASLNATQEYGILKKYFKFFADSVENRLRSLVRTFSITLNTSSTDEFETGIDITYCTIFNRFGTDSLQKKEHHFSTEFPESVEKTDSKAVTFSLC
jgi:hypothetical protein